MEPIGAHNIQRFLTAFADGELDADQNVEVLRYLAAHPDALAMLEQEQQLRAAARRAVREGTPAVPAALQATIQSMMMRHADESHASIAMDRPRASPPHLFGRWARLSIAALVLLAAGALAGRYGFHSGERPSTVAPQVAQREVPLTVVTAVTRVHVDCSRFDAALHAGEFPKPFAELAGWVRADLASDKPYPDLSQAGYTLIGAGPCAHPLEDTAHLLYRSTRPRVNDTLSVFVQPFTGQYPIDEGKAYQMTGPDAVHPMFVWRSSHVVYFLVGDDLAEVTAARDAIEIRKL